MVSRRRSGDSLVRSELVRYDVPEHRGLLEAARVDSEMPNPTAGKGKEKTTAPNPRPGEPRLWKDRNYRRLKQCHNYYSP